MGTEGYEFDSKLNRVVPSKSNMLINLDQDWDQDMDQWNSDESFAEKARNGFSPAQNESQESAC